MFILTRYDIVVCPDQCRIQADIVMVIDHSGSINHVDPDNWSRIQEFIDRFISGLTIGPDDVRLAVVGYGKQNSVQLTL
jgi:hypothetical protein